MVKSRGLIAGGVAVALAGIGGTIAAGLGLSSLSGGSSGGGGGAEGVGGGIGKLAAIGGYIGLGFGIAAVIGGTVMIGIGATQVPASQTASTSAASRGWAAIPRLGMRF